MQHCHHGLSGGESFLNRIISDVCNLSCCHPLDIMSKIDFTEEKLLTVQQTSIDSMLVRLV